MSSESGGRSPIIFEVTAGTKGSGTGEQAVAVAVEAALDSRGQQLFESLKDRQSRGQGVTSLKGGQTKREDPRITPGILCFAS